MKTPKPPKHLRPATRRWIDSVLSEFVLEEHHQRLLLLAAGAWDRAEQAREALAEAKSLTYTDRFGSPKPRPEVAIERDSKVVFARLLRELGLDVAAPGEASRPPVIVPHASLRVAR